MGLSSGNVAVGLLSHYKSMTYTYKARDKLGRLVKGKLAADNEADLFNRLRKMEYFLISSKVDVFPGAVTTAKKAGQMSPAEVLNFTSQLATFLDAGVPLLGSLKELSGSIAKKNVRIIVEDITYRVESGASLKEALAVYPNIFSKLYVAIIGAGESTGKLSVSLSDLANLLEWQLDLRSKIREASIYPVILFCAMIGAVSLLLIVVIPKLERIFQDLNVPLPLPTQIILNTSHFLSAYWWLLLALIGLLSGAWIFINSIKTGRYQIDRLKLKLPILGGFLNKIAISRFCHTFSLSLRSGIAVLGALDISSDVMANEYLKTGMGIVRDNVNIGKKISESLTLSGIFPVIVVRMISVGEQTGTLADAFEKVNKFYDKEIPAFIRKMFALAEPLIMVFLGFVVGGIALSVFLPLVTLVRTIGG